MSDRSQTLKQVARRIGQLVTMLAFVFVGWALFEQRGALGNWQPSVSQVLMLALLVAVYCAALGLLAFNWATIVQTLVQPSPPVAPLLLSYTKTQIAKYIPGNIVHLVSRHIFLKDFGLDHRPLATASVIELASLPLCAVIAACLVVPFVGGAGQVHAQLETLAPLFLAMAAGIAALVSWRIQRSWRMAALRVLSRGVGFMVFQGTIFAVVLFVVSGSFVAVAIPAAIFAWLVGFLTPAAPGGIAVREALLVGLLAQAAAGDELLIAALILRVITTAGDLALYIAGNVMLGKRVAAITDSPHR
ncbi:hypothetical protein [Yoonia tamlensis]|nr:hypothetical protein [Yoonia tamlensis]